jgi:hypothetical protein
MTISLKLTQNKNNEIIKNQEFKFPIYFKETLLTDAVVASVDITRYAIADGLPIHNKVVLSTDAGMCFIEKGVSNWRIDITTHHGMNPNDAHPPFIEVNAVWFNSIQALRKNITVTAGNSANTFGKMGVFLVPDRFEIPTTMANPENIKFYGLELIENHKVLTIRSEKVDIVMMQYHYESTYKKEFLMQEFGGGGVFLETHDFPHIHIPLSEDCGGYIVIGKCLEPDLFCFTAFQIPYGYALYTPSNTIHGDGTLVGKYGLTVADPSMISADTVLIYNKNTYQTAKDVVPDWP